MFHSTKPIGYQPPLYASKLHMDLWSRVWFSTYYRDPPSGIARLPIGYNTRIPN